MQRSYQALLMQAQPQAGCRVVLGSGEEVGDPPAAGARRGPGRLLQLPPREAFALKRDQSGWVRA